MKMMIEEEENNDSNNNHNLVVLDKLAGMFHQEESDGYKVPPFLDNIDNNDLQYHQYNHRHHHYCPPSPLTSSSSSQQPPVDILARQSIAKWCYKIMSILKYSSETAEIAMSCLDRFVSSSSSPLGQYCLRDRHQYRLAALTCVYTISKVHESTALSIGFVIKLSSNNNATSSSSPPPFTRKEIESMEIQILMGLQFRINPITTIEYVYSYLNLLPQSSMGYETRRVLIELCQYQITRSVVEYKFCIEKKSMIGFASLLNAIDSIYKDDGRTAWDVESMITHYVPNLVVMTQTSSSTSLQRLRSMLYETVASDDNLETSSKLLLLQGCSYYHQVASSTTSSTSSRTRTGGTPPSSSSSPPPTEITITNHRRSDVDDDNNDNNKSKSSSSKGPGLSNSPRSATYMM